MSDDSIDDVIEKMMSSIATEGVACTKVQDGHVFVFSEKVLRSMLDKISSSGADKITVFVKEASPSLGIPTPQKILH
jgi:hypothetical protein